MIVSLHSCLFVHERKEERVRDERERQKWRKKRKAEQRWTENVVTKERIKEWK